ncbi:hypothetical protein LFM09_26115 [Lentzea alba]|uniref:hypothetical protein n=1 Tax=Lentzea alba TaxID=2714351 RepID=UPI0039BEDB15
MVAALGAALALTVGMAAPASATHKVTSQVECNNSFEFVHFYRHNDPMDKYCYAGESPQIGNKLNTGLAGITWFNSGSNWGEIWFRDQHGTPFHKVFTPRADTGCDWCFIDAIRITASE